MILLHKDYYLKLATDAFNWNKILNLGLDEEVLDLISETIESLQYKINSAKELLKTIKCD